MLLPLNPTALPLQRGLHHGVVLFGAIQDCGPDRWGRILIERAVRKHVLASKPYRALDYVLALDDISRIGALRFRTNADGPFLAATAGKIPPVVQLGALLNAADAVYGETETAKDRRFLLGAGSPLGGARPKSTVSLPDGSLAIAKFPKPDDIRDIAAGEILADLRELWRRLVFSLLASNYDDHLHNHGFLMRAPGCWSLSPAYDLNPVPEIDRAHMPKTAISEHQEESSIAAAMAVTAHFGLKTGEAKNILDEIFSVVSTWRKTGRQLRIKASTLDAYTSAFDHSLMDETRRFLRA